MIRNKRRTVNRIVEENYWTGFFSYLENGSAGALSYASDSDYYQFNEVAKIAHMAGYNYAEEVLKLRADRLAGNGLRFFTINREVPGKVYAEAYGAARIAA